jgi:hypothetical protein
MSKNKGDVNMADQFPTIANEEKRQVYAELKSKLKLALSKEFYFEAVMLEYAIIEDSTASVLFHAGVCKNPYDSSKKLSNKLNSIEQQMKSTIADEIAAR